MPNVSSARCDVGRRKRIEGKRAGWVMLLYCTCAFTPFLSHIYPFVFKKKNHLCRCPLARRAASGSGTRPCRGPSANAAAVSPPCGGWTPPPRGRQRGTLPSIRRAPHCDGAPLRPIAVATLRFNLILLLQVFVDGMEPAKEPVARTFEDSASEKAVRTPISLFYSCCCCCWDVHTNTRV